MHFQRALCLKVFSVLIMLVVSGCAGKAPAGGFVQPTEGPGGQDYRHAEITAHTYHKGTSEEYWIFEPASPIPRSAPLVVFNHGWSAMDPAVYGAWIKHLVRRGNIVVYPRYQENMRTSMRDFTPNAIAAVKAAIRELLSGSHVRPELRHFAIVGHSMGAAITANMAAMAASEGLPQPRAIMCVEPGSFVIGRPEKAMPLADFGEIPPATLLLMVIGEEDTLAGDVDAKRIYSQIPQIPADNKDFVTVMSDYHGEPPLIANHHAPTARDESIGAGERRRLGGRLRDRVTRRKGIGTVNALDYYGFWKLFDALMDAAFKGKNREYALGNTPAQRNMGRWPDGTKVKELMVTDKP